VLATCSESTVHKVQIENHSRSQNVTDEKVKLQLFAPVKNMNVDAPASTVQHVRLVCSCGKREQWT
jgi:hypothetical protein